jgi:hypothetical protein
MDVEETSYLAVVAADEVLQGVAAKAKTIRHYRP